MRALVFCLAALFWCGAANAEPGDGMAAYNNGDLKTAAIEFQKLPKKGGFVLYTLGVMFESGDGVEKDEKAAAEWFRQAATQTDTDVLWTMLSEHNLGVMYAEGRGVPQDYKAAMEWYRKAAGRGNSSSQYNLGVMHAKGEGTPVNLAEAKKWLDMAAAAGDERAAELSRAIEKAIAANHTRL